ncbi:MAG: acetoacetate--CoA ligase [SAR324 cluster bacterium]|nr:acetoacetate--CoA ligase [SAR324 cluster bacterium]
MNELLWKPSSEQEASSQITRLSQRIQRKYALADAEYSTLHHWSVTHPHLFWEEVWQDCEIKSSVSYTKVMGAPKMPGTSWFEGTRLNFAENLLRYQNKEQEAICFVDEEGRTASLSYQELSQKVFQCAAGFRAHGVQKGDRISAVIPNCPETIIAALAASSIGAIWSSCSPDFGINGIYDRLGQINPKLLITANAYQYNGKVFDCLEKIKGVLGKINSVQTTIVIPFIDVPDKSFANSQRWDELLNMGEPEFFFEQLPFDHPLYIMYSSGTTGIPKSMVHGAGGTLIQHLKEHRYHCDLKKGDRICYFTTCGWMMWNWLVSSLASGATVVLYEGSPSYPDISQLWNVMERFRITHFGTSPKFLSAVKKAGYVPKDHHPLSSLRVMMSTGAPLSDELFYWVYEHVKFDLHLASISGGTDLISCFALGNPNLAVHAGELQCKGLGMDVHAYSPAGESLIGEKGELVCRTPFPSMPIYFWNDPDGEKYRKAYFDEYPDVWAHGDFIELTESGGAVIYGRSDTVLNPGGVRIGTAEIYRQVEGMPEVVDSIVIGQNWEGDVRIILFVVLPETLTLDDALCDQIKKTIRVGTTPRHVPELIFQVPEIPHTISGKKVEKAVRQIMDGEEILNVSALANPEALHAFSVIATDASMT